MKSIRVYADTSVFGGVFDREYRSASISFFDQVKSRSINLYTSAVVSWNFKHIVHYEKIALYNSVNILEGYPQVSIYSPLEVIKYE